MRVERTLRRTVSCTGIGLHSGKQVHLSLRPAPAGSGITFRRTDLDDFNVQARVDAVCSVDHATTLICGQERLGTVEHCLAALAGIGVDNARIEVDAEEIPILDGSSAPFVYLIHEAGIRLQSRPRRYLRVRRPVEVRDGDRYVCFYPQASLRLSYSIEFDHPVIGRQRGNYVIDPSSFQDEIASARTFGFLKEVEAMRRAGLAQGGSLENAVVLGEHDVLNPLRFQDEFVRHKILDLLGDLSLIGMPLLAHVDAHKAGHALHVEATRELLATADAYEVVTWGQGAVKPSATEHVPQPVGVAAGI